MPRTGSGIACAQDDVIIDVGHIQPVLRPRIRGGFRMTLTFRSILLLIAVVLFVLAAVGIDVGAISLVPLGLACFAGAFVAPDTVVSTRR